MKTVSILIIFVFLFTNTNGLVDGDLYDFPATSSPFTVPVTLFLPSESSEDIKIGEEKEENSYDLLYASSIDSALRIKSIERNEYSNPYPTFHLLTPHSNPEDMKSEIGQKEKRIDLMNSQPSSEPIPNLSPLYYSSVSVPAPVPVPVTASTSTSASPSTAVAASLSPSFLNHQELPYKSIVICDKTLAILDYTSVLLKCDLYDLEKNPDVAYSEVRKTGLEMKSISFQEMRRIINNCRALDEVDLTNSTVTNAASTASSTVTSGSSDLFSTEFISSWRALLPGTKWCGSGDSARAYSDLGKRKELDICCRAHDHCPVRLKALRSGYGLINFSLYTKSHCDCDEDFRKCLKSLNSKSADALANFFFNILRVQCIREEALKHCTGEK